MIKVQFINDYADMAGEEYIEYELTGEEAYIDMAGELYIDNKRVAKLILNNLAIQVWVVDTTGYEYYKVRFTEVA